MDERREAEPGAGRRDAALVILGHGASGTAASMRPWVEGLGGHGIDARAIDLPKGRAERAVPVFGAAIEAAGRPVVAGGHSFGGRVASLALAGAEGAAAPEGAARGAVAPAEVRGLLLLSYPLHRPGAPETWRERTAHWPRLRCPVLLLSGESDPFARIDLLRDAVRLLPDAQLVTYPRVGHGLAAVLDDALDRAAAFVEAVSDR